MPARDKDRRTKGSRVSCPGLVSSDCTKFIMSDLGVESSVNVNALRTQRTTQRTGHDVSDTADCASINAEDERLVQAKRMSVIVGMLLEADPYANTRPKG